MSEQCTHLEIKLMDAPDARNITLDERDRAHLAQCAPCREFLESCLGAAASLQHLGGEARGQQMPAARAQALKSQVLQRARQTLQQAQAPHPLRVEKPADAPSFWDKLLPFFSGQRGFYWATATACLVLTLGGYTFWARSQPVGQATYALGDLNILNENQQFHGLLARGLARGAHLATGADGGAIAQLDGDQIRLALKADSDIELTSARQLRLVKGSVWLNVTPGGKGFRVETAGGEVVVTGTIFGVTQTSGALQVDVTRGHVIVRETSEERGISAGQTVSGSMAGLGAVAQRSGGIDLPAWVETLTQAEAKARNKSYIPSVTVKGI